jgi:hypothetical protein
VAPQGGSRGAEARRPAIPENGEPPKMPVRLDWKPFERGDVVDPGGDCRVDLDRSQDRILIRVPGTPHVLSAELGRLNAPRLLRAVEGDFDAVVRVEGVFQPAGRTTMRPYAPYHGAGILVWQDEANYLRLELAADLKRGKVHPYANFELRKDGLLAFSRGLDLADGTTYLRLARRGGEFLAAFGPDGNRWTWFPPLADPLTRRVKLGVAAINTATKLLTVELKGFHVSTEPSAAGR